MNTRLSTLPGGLRVATCEMPHAETVSVSIWAAVGGRHEPRRLSGISHFIEHMIFKGTPRRSARRVMEEVEGVGGDMNAFTAEERTCYYANAPAEFFPRLCDVLCDIYLHAKFADGDIELERGVIAEEILMYQDEPSSHVQDLLNARFWPDHPLGRPLTGTLSSTGALHREDFLDFRASHYHQRSTVVSAAGRISHEDVLAGMKALTEELPTGCLPRAVRAPSAARRLRVVTESRDVQQTQVAIGWPAPSVQSPERFALHLLHILLGGNGSSRLFQKLREQRGLCYSVGTHPNQFADTGQFNLSIGLDGKNLEKSLALIRSEILRLQEFPPRPAELRRAQEYAVGASRMSLERPSAQSLRVGGSLLAYGKIASPESIHARLRAVTADEISHLAKKCLRWESATVAAIGPSPEENRIRESLEA